MNKKTTLVVGALLAGLAVALGAFGSHGLKDFLAQAGRTETFETAGSLSNVSCAGHVVGWSIHE